MKKKKFNSKNTTIVVGFTACMFACMAYGFVVGAGTASVAIGINMRESIEKNSDILLRDYISER